MKRDNRFATGLPFSAADHRELDDFGATQSGEHAIGQVWKPLTKPAAKHEQPGGAVQGDPRVVPKRLDPTNIVNADHCLLA